MDRIETDLLNILHKRLGIEPGQVGSDSALSDLGDSLDFVDILGDVETFFGLELSNEQISAIRTFGDLALAVRGQLVAEPVHVAH